jgi:hypothetical protein
MKCRVVKPARAESFGDYDVRGIWYEENDAMDRAWHITAALRTGIWNKHYWVAEKQFFGVRMNDEAVQVLDPIVDVEPEAKAAILEAIKKWESEA